MLASLAKMLKMSAKAVTEKWLVTGGCGFIGSHFVEQVLNQYPQVELFNVDLLTYAAHPMTSQRLQDLGGDRYHLLKRDVSDPILVGEMGEIAPQKVIHFAAESHVDRSILDPNAFVRTNVLGIQNLLNGCRKVGNQVRFLNVSTDEVYGSLEPQDPPFTELSPLHANSPYAASKASADLMVLANGRTFGQDVVITRCTNNYGPYQFPEKLIPVVIARALDEKSIPVYGDGLQVRDWIHVKDHVSAILEVLEKGDSGEVYNISSRQERKNIDLVKTILKLLNRPESLIQYVGDRPAHDRRYGLGADKVESELGWKPSFTFQEGIEQTVNWYQENQNWWRPLQDENYQKYYQANYQSKNLVKEARV